MIVLDLRPPDQDLRDAARTALAWQFSAEDLAHLMSIAIGGRCADTLLGLHAETWRDGVIAMHHAPIPFACSFIWASA